jgi:polysaccharide export outer membrane protein
MFRIRIFGVALAVSLAAASAGLQAQQNRPVATPVTPQAMTEPNTSTSKHDSNQPSLQQRNPRYQIHREDILSISFPLSPEFDQPKVMVQPDGYVNLQGAGSVYIQGMTLPEVVDTFKKAYSSTLHEPIVDVDLVDFQRPFFLVSGQVNKPGEFDLRHDTTVSQAIATAGGFAPTARTQVFLYHRVSADWVEVKKLSVKDILNGKNVNEDAQLSPGDMIFVPEKFITKFRKYVPYGVGTSVSTSPTYY